MFLLHVDNLGTVRSFLFFPHFWFVALPDSHAIDLVVLARSLLELPVSALNYMPPVCSYRAQRTYCDG